MQHACRAHRNAVVSAGANRAVGWVRAPHHGGPRQAARSASVAVAVAVAVAVGLGVLLAMSAHGRRCACTWGAAGSGLPSCHLQ